MEEKEVKNEVPAPETDRKKEPEKQVKEKKELTPQQIQQRKKMLVYPLMGLVFLGSMYLIFAPSDKDEAKVENVGGFNADIPQPKGDGIISDKKTAYEQEQMENKQADKMRSLQDFAFSLGEENGNGEDLTLIDDAPAEKPKTNVIDFGVGAPNNSRYPIFGGSLPGHEPSVRQFLRNAERGQRKRGTQTSGGRTHCPARCERKRGGQHG